MIKKLKSKIALLTMVASSFLCIACGNPREISVSTIKPCVIEIDAYSNASQIFIPEGTPFTVKCLTCNTKETLNLYKNGTVYCRTCSDCDCSQEFELFKVKFN